MSGGGGLSQGRDIGGRGLVPPLAFLALLWSASAALAAAAWLVERQALAGWIALGAATLLLSGLASALLVFAGPRALFRALCSAPSYVLRKLPLYLGFFGRRETLWRKTERSSAPRPPPSDEERHERSDTGT